MPVSLSSAPKSVALAALCALALGLLPSSARALYKVVGPGGQVTYSDHLPEGSARSNTLDVPAATSGGAETALPYALKQVVGRYPVVLYTAADCAPCASGRTLLQQRGVPFHERTIGSVADQDALHKISGTRSLPVLQVGSKTISGFQSAQWNSYLSAAGYPENSALPANYRAPAATPLAPSAPVAAPAAETPQSLRPTPPAAAPARGNPAGIRF